MATTATAPAAALHREGPSTFAAAGALSLGPESPAEPMDTATTANTTGCFFDGLDDHVLLQIAQHLEPRDALNLRRTARRFYRALSGVLPLTDFVAHAVRSIDAELQFQDLHAFRHGTDIVHVERQLAVLCTSGLTNVAAAYALAVAKQVLSAERVKNKTVTLLATGETYYHGGVGHLWLYGLLHQFADLLPGDLTILLVQSMQSIRGHSHVHGALSIDIGLKDLLHKLARLGVDTLSDPEAELRRQVAAACGKSASEYGFVLASLFNWCALEYSINTMRSLVDECVKLCPPRRAFTVLHWAHYYGVPCSLRELVPRALDVGRRLQQFTFDDKRLIVRWLFADAELKDLCSHIIRDFISQNIYVGGM